MITKEKNIPLNDVVFNKYKNVNEIFKSERLDEENGYYVMSKLKIEKEFIFNLSNTDIYHFAVIIFKKYHNINIFNNNRVDIIVSNTDIKESINKINNNSLQKRYLKEHLIIFSDLGNIIRNEILVNQTLENKDRSQNKLWSYYLIKLVIENVEFLFEFDVIYKENKENHYRIQRLEKI